MINKYVLRTSLIWIALIACGAAFFTLRSRAAKPQPTPLLTVEPLAVGSAEQAPPSGPKESPAPEAARAPVELTPEQSRSIGARIAMAQWKNIADDIHVTGTVDVNERTLTSVQIRFPGYVRKVFANATYQYVRKGDPLFTVYSPELVATENEYLLSLQNQNRLQGSSVDGVASGAAALTDAGEARLRQWEISREEIERVKSSGEALSEIPIDSPVSGYVTERNALPNLYVEASTRLYAIADFSRVWVYAQIFQDDAGRVKPGDLAQITVDAYPGETFRGRIESILPQMDMTTRTVRARLDIANPGLKLKPGMYVNVSLKAAIGRRLIVPASAVLELGTRQVVYVEKSGQLEAKDVLTGPRVNDDIVIKEGLSENDRVAASAGFLIDSESQLQAAAGAYTPPPRGAGQAQPQEKTTVNIEFSTDPTPPRKGSNALRVKLTGASTATLDKADVTVVFFMPAMPAMGMAAMTTQVTMTAAADREYRGTGVLQSGGPCQVTITVKKGGQLLGSKQLHVNATGGM